MASHLNANVARFSGFADCYDAYRPSPPPILLDVLTQLAQVPRPRLIVDLGSGTGISTRLWIGRAEQIIGIEPNADMRHQAELHTTGSPAAQSIRYQEGLSTQTGLHDACADIVTCCQSLHWMEPQPTFREIARILRSGGIFAACDTDWPPTTLWEADAAYSALEQRVDRLEEQVGVFDEVRKWTKSEHLSRMAASGQFRFTKEIVLHSIESGNAERLVGLALSQGGIQSLLKRGLSEDQIGLTEFRTAVHRILGDKPMPWYFSYRVRVGVK
ncbi:MAG TPA: class I SAM-dependent methyltransferase [Tepidisphaeraceae bacterium]|nr:class I SAM-dependent methyltransferase [Tepidisphaeraceae bacterium]